MKLRSLFAMVFVSIIITPAALAEVRVDVILFKPPNNQLTMENLWNARLTTTDGPVDVFLRGYLITKGDTVLSGYSSNTLTLATGTRTVRSADVKGVRDVRHKEGYQSLTIRGGQAPEGRYIACLEVYDNETKRRLGVNCIQVEVVLPGAPRLISPPDGAKLAQNQNPLFSWTRVGEGPYTLTIVEVMGRQTPEQALRDNKPWFEQGNIRATSLIYPTSARQWPDSGHWCWQVAAKPQGGAVAASEVWQFSSFKAPQGGIQGTVMDAATGAAIEGASVLAWTIQYNPLEVKQAYTGMSGQFGGPGRYAYSEPKGGICNVTVSRQGYVTKTMFGIAWRQFEWVEREFTLAKGSGEVVIVEPPYVESPRPRE